MRSRVFFCSLRRAMLASLFTVPVAASANLSTNPSFETGPNPGATLALAVGATSVTGWVVTRNPIEYIGTRWNAADGTRSISLNGTSPGGIAQTFPTTPGVEYSVRFMMAADAFSNPVLKHMRVEAAGQSQEYEFDGTHSWEWDLGWLEKTFTFVADATTTTLEFYSLDAGEQGPALDNVIVEASTTGTPFDGNGGFTLATSPNPASGAFAVRFSLPSATVMRLGVWDVAGREVQVLATGALAAGSHLRRWDGAALQGRAAAGVYIVRLEAPGVSIARKVVLAR
jgi:choice-of-anchor C domain-containing protein